MATAATAGAACGDLAAPAPPESPLSDQLIVYALLIPDEARQAVLIAPADGIARPELSGVTLAIHQREDAAAEWTLVGRWRDPYREDCSLLGIIPLFVNLRDRGPYCFAPEIRLQAGATYRVEVAADGRSPARGETRVVGGFEVARAALTSSSLSAEWTASVAAHRYFMGIRRIWDPTCDTCERAWYADLADTKFDGAVPGRSIELAGPRPILEVVAVDQHLHAFLTTGHEGALHDIHPKQNVVGGFGVVGSLLARSRAIERR